MELLERDRELQQLDDVLGRARQGSGRVVLVRGEAGIGKTSLLKVFTSVHRDDTHILWGTCDDLITPRPLGPLWDIADQEPELLKALSGGDRLGVFRLTVDLLRRELKPTILVVDDTQWADEATLDVLKFVGRRIEDSHGLLLITYRDEEMATDHPLRFVIGDLQPDVVSRIALAPLSEEAVGQLIAESDATSRLVEEAAGNPFLLNEVINASDDRIPASIRDAFLARVGRLSQEARSIVDLVAVVPGRAETWLLGDRADTAALDETVDRGILEHDKTSVGFRHELARRAVEESLSRRHRQQINTAVLRTLVENNADPTRIVHHAQQANDVARLLEYVPGAARTAAAMSSHREALTLYRLIGSHIDQLEPSAQASVAEGWSEEALLGREPEEARELAQRAVEIRLALGEPERLSAALQGLSTASWWCGDREAAEDNAAASVAALDGRPRGRGLALALTRKANLAMLAYDMPRTMEATEEALEVAREVGATDAEVIGLITQGSMISVVAYPDGLDLIERGRRLAVEIGSDIDAARALVNTAGIAVDHRDMARARRATEMLLRFSIDRDLEAFEVTAHYFNALIDFFVGNWLEAEEVLRPGLALRPTDVGQTARLTVLGRIQARRGSQEASVNLDRAWEKATIAAELQRTGYAAAARAEHAWLEGRIDEIPGLASPDLDRAESAGAPFLIGDLALWMWKAGATTEPPKACAEPYRLMIAGDWEAAAAAWEGLDSPYERAIALMDGNTGARLEALRIFDALGATPLATRLRRELRDAGVKGVPRGPQRSTRAHGVGLTARQQEVLELMAEGMSNPEIADRLFISARTAEHHVSAILSKLEAGNRDDAVAAARKTGLV